jgi:plastocyanin
VFPGPRTETYQLPALKAGDYYFHCDAHPGMSGELKVKSG